MPEESEHRPKLKALILMQSTLLHLFSLKDKSVKPTAATVVFQELPALLETQENMANQADLDDMDIPDNQADQQQCAVNKKNSNAQHVNLEHPDPLVQPDPQVTLERQASLAAQAKMQSVELLAQQVRKDPPEVPAHRDLQETPELPLRAHLVNLEILDLQVILAPLALLVLLVNLVKMLVLAPLALLDLLDPLAVMDSLENKAQLVLQVKMADKENVVSARNIAPWTVEFSSKTVLSLRHKA